MDLFWWISGHWALILQDIHAKDTDRKQSWRFSNPLFKRTMPWRHPGNPKKGGTSDDVRSTRTAWPKENRPSSFSTLWISKNSTWCCNCVLGIGQPILSQNSDSGSKSKCFQVKSKTQVSTKRKLEQVAGQVDQVFLSIHLDTFQNLVLAVKHWLPDWCQARCPATRLKRWF